MAEKTKQKKNVKWKFCQFFAKLEKHKKNKKKCSCFPSPLSREFLKTPQDPAVRGSRGHRGWRSGGGGQLDAGLGPAGPQTGKKSQNPGGLDFSDENLEAKPKKTQKWLV